VAFRDAAEVDDVCAAAIPALANSTAPVNKPSLIIDLPFVLRPLDKRTATTARSYRGEKAVWA
jgi:hypothetical protein